MTATRQPGRGTSWPQAKLRQESSMSDRSEISNPQTSPAIGNATSSQESESGPAHCEMQAGPTKSRSGRGRALAPIFPVQENVEDSTETATSGPTATVSTRDDVTAQSHRPDACVYAPLPLG